MSIIVFFIDTHYTTIAICQPHPPAQSWPTHVIFFIISNMTWPKVAAYSTRIQVAYVNCATCCPHLNVGVYICPKGLMWPIHGNLEHVH